MECTVSWTGGNAVNGSKSGMTFLAETGSGHTLVMAHPTPPSLKTAVPTWHPGPWKPCLPAQVAARLTTWC